MKRTPDVLEAPAGTMPASCGVFRAAVFLPAEAAEWSSQQRRMVLLHEFAHIHRGDPAAHLVGRMALGFYWWNPLAWLGWREFLKERERAADDVVLLTGAPATEYAGYLLEIARSVRSAPAIESMAVAMARRSQLEDRLVMILNTGTRRGRSHHRWPSIAALGIALLIGPPFAALRAQDDAQVVPADVDATIRAAAAQKNHELLESAASAAIAFQKYDLAQKLLESSLAIRAETAGQQSVDYGIGLLKLGDLERNRNNFSEAEVFYAKAVSVLGNRPEAAPALVNLGTAALRMRKKEGPHQAIDYFQRAQTADPSHAGVATMWLAVVREQQGSPEEADALYRQALSLQDQKSAPAATTMELYARFLRQQGRTDEANTIAEQASAVRKELGSHAPAIRQASAPNGIHIGAGVTAPTLAYKVEPQYTEEARQAKYQGTVIVSTVIGTGGTAQDMRVIRGLGLGLDEKAIQAISNWRFSPGLKDGKPVPVVAQIEVNFRLL
jgi:TonB family protein